MSLRLAFASISRGRSDRQYPLLVAVSSLQANPRRESHPFRRPPVQGVYADYGSGAMGNEDMASESNQTRILTWSSDLEVQLVLGR